MKPAGGTADFVLWKRVGRVRERSILAEGEWPGAVLRCGTERGRAVLAGGGVAAVRRLPIVAPLPVLAAGATFPVDLNLPPGEWDLEAPYTSSQPVRVTAPGLDTVLPANLDRPGTRLPIGRLEVRSRPLTISFHVEDTPLLPAGPAANLVSLIATPAGERDRVVPIARACGQSVDWYRPASG